MPAERTIRFNVEIRRVGGATFQKLVGEMRQFANAAGRFASSINRLQNVNASKAAFDNLTKAVEGTLTAIANVKNIDVTPAVKQFEMIRRTVGDTNAQMQLMKQLIDEVNAIKSRVGAGRAATEEENEARRVKRTADAMRLKINEARELVQAELARSRASRGSESADVASAKALRAHATELERARAKGVAAVKELERLSQEHEKLGVNVTKTAGLFNQAAAGLDKEAQSARTAAAAIEKNAAAQKKQAQEQQRAAVATKSLSAGFDNIVKQQLRFFASSILVFGAITNIRRAFESLLELQDRTAKAFAVSRSEVILLEERFNSLREAIVDFSSQTGQSVKDVSEILFQFGSAGLQAEESLAALESTLNLIIATDADVTSTTKTVAATYRLLGGSVAGTGTKLEAFARINDVLAATYRNNQVELNELNQGLKFALPVAKQLGLSLEETTGILATLQNNFIRAGEAGRSMRSIFARITSQQAEFQRAFGIAFDPEKPLDFLDLIRQINIRLGNGQLTANQVGTVFERLGLRGANSFLILTQKTGDLNETIRKLQEESQGAAEAMADTRVDELSRQFSIFKNILLEVAREALQPIALFLGAIIKIMQAMREALRDNAIGDFLAIVLKLATALLALKVVMLAVNLVTGLLAGTTAGAALGITAMTGTTLTLTGALGGLRLALVAVQLQMHALWLTNPYLLVIGLIIAAIAAATAAYLIFSKTVAESVEASREAIKEMTTEINERQKQIDSIKNTRRELELLQQQVDNGALSTDEAAIAIGNVAGKYGDLAEAAIAAGGDLAVFNDKVGVQLRILEQLQKQDEQERESEFKKSLDDVLSTIQQANKDIRKFGPEVARFNKSISATTDVQQLRALRSASYEARAALKDAKEESSEVFKQWKLLIKESPRLAIKFSEASNQARSLFTSLGLVKEEALTTADAFSTTVNAMEKVKALRFGQEISGITVTMQSLADAAKSLQIFSLFKFDVIIDDTELQALRDSIARLEGDFEDTLDKVTGATATFAEDLPSLIVNPQEVERAGTIFANTLVSNIQTAVNKNRNILRSSFINQKEAIELSRRVSFIRQYDLGLVEKTAATEEQRAQAVAGLATLQSTIIERLRQQLKLRANGITDQVRLNEITRENAAALGRVEQLFGNINELNHTLLFTQLASVQALFDITKFLGALNKSERIASVASLSRLGNVKREISLTSQRKNLIKDELDIQKESLKNISASSDTSEKARAVAVTQQEQVNNVLKAGAKQRIDHLNAEQELIKATIQTLGINRRSSQLGDKSLNTARAQLGVAVDTVNAFEERKRRAAELHVVLEDIEILSLREAQNNEAILKATEKLIAASRSRSNAIRDAIDKTELLQSGNSKLTANLQKQRRLIEEIGSREQRIAKDKEKGVRLDSQSFTVRAKAAAAEAELLDDRRELLELSIQESNVRFGILRTIATEAAAFSGITDKALKILGIEKTTQGIENRRLGVQLKFIAGLTRFLALQREIDSQRRDSEALSTEQQLRLTAAAKDQYGLAVAIFEVEKKNLKDNLTKEVKLNQQLLDIYERQYQAIATNASEVNDILSGFVTQQFDTGPFSSLLYFSDELKLTWTEISRIGPQGVAKELFAQLRRGEVDVDNIGGAFGDALRLLKEYNDQQKALIELQNDIKTARFDNALELISTAIDTGNLGLANTLYKQMADNVEQLDPIEQTLDPGVVSGRLAALKVIAEGIKENFGASKDEITRSVERLSKVQEIINSLNRQTNEFSRALAEGQFTDEFANQLTDSVNKLSRIVGLETDYATALKTAAAAIPVEKMADLEKVTLATNDQIERMSESLLEVIDPMRDVASELRDIANKLDGLDGTEIRVVVEGLGIVPAVIKKYQTGGMVPGVGEGDIIPALLEPGEFVIPRSAVEAFGVSFFENFRNPDAIHRAQAIKGILGYKHGGPVGYQTGGLAISGTSEAILRESLVPSLLDDLKNGTYLNVEKLGLIEQAMAELLRVWSGNEIPPDFKLSQEDKARLDDLITKNSEVAKAFEQLEFFAKESSYIETQDPRTKEQFEEDKKRDTLLASIASKVDLADEKRQELSKLSIDELIKFNTAMEELVAHTKADESKREALVDRIVAAGGPTSEQYEKFSTDLLEGIAKGFEKERKEEIVAAIPKEDIGPGRREELLGLSIERLEDVAATFKELSKIEIAEESKEILQQDTIRITFSYEEGYEKLRSDLANLSPTKVEIEADEDSVAAFIDKISKIESTALVGLGGTGAAAGFQAGGTVPGSGLGDIIPALLEPGEFVIPRGVVGALGTGFFNQFLQPEFIQELASLNRKRDRGELGFFDFINATDDVRANVRGFKHGGPVGYRSGGVARYQFGGAASGSAVDLIRAIDIFRNDLIFELRSGVIRNLEKLIEIGTKILDVRPASAEIEIKPETVDTFVDVADTGADFASVMVEADKNTEATSDSVKQLNAETSKGQSIVAKASEERAKAQETAERNQKKAIELQKKFGLTGQSALSDVSAAMNAFKRHVSQANSTTNKFASDLLNAFGARLVRAIQKISDIISETFISAIPAAFDFFVGDFLTSLGEIVSKNDEAVDKIVDSYLKSRGDLVEQLKRNEISYFDYFNRLEDLNADTNASLAEGTENVAEEMDKVLGDFIQDFFGRFTDVLGDLTNKFFEFTSEVGQSMQGLALNFFDLFGQLGGAAGQLIGGLVGGGGAVGGAAAGAFGAGAAGGVAGGPAGAVVGVAAGAIIGGVVGEALKSLVPIAGAIFEAFNTVVNTIIQAALSIIPVIVQLGLMGQDEIEALATAIQEELPVAIQRFIDNFASNLETVTALLVQELPGIVDDFIRAFEEAVPAIGDALITLGPVFVEQFAKFIVAAAATLPALFDDIGESIGATLQALLQTGLIDQIGPIVSSLLDALLSVFNNVGIPLATAFAEAAPGVVTALVGAILAAAPELATAGFEIISIVASTLADPAVLQEIGTAIMDSFKNFIGGFAGGDLEVPGIENLFGVLFGALESISSVLPVVVGLMTSMASISGSLITVFDEVVTVAFIPMLNSVLPLFDTFVQLLTLFTPMVAVLGQVATAVGGLLNAFSGPFAEFIALVQGGIFDLISELVDVLSMFSGSAQDVLGVFVNAIKQLTPLVSVLASAIFGSLSEVVGVVFEILSAAITVIGGVATVAVSLISVFTSIINILVQLIPFFTVLIEAVLKPFVRIITILVTIINLVVKSFSKLASTFFRVFGGVIDVIAKALVPVLQIVADVLLLMLPVLEALTPVIEILITIGLLPLIGVILLLLAPLLLLVVIFEAVNYIIGQAALFLGVINDAMLVWTRWLDLASQEIHEGARIIEDALSTATHAVEKFLLPLRYLEIVLKAIEHALWGGSLIPALEALWSVIETVTGFVNELAATLQTGLVTALSAVFQLISDFLNSIPGLEQVSEATSSFGEAAVETAQNVNQAAGDAAGGNVPTVANIGGQGSGLLGFGGVLHDGGIFGKSDDLSRIQNLRANEGIAVLQHGEGVLTAQGVAAAGGPAGIAALNSGANLFGAPQGEAGGNYGSSGVTQVGNQNITNEENFDIEVKFENCSFNGEDVAEVVEENIVTKLRDKDGDFYNEITKKGKNGDIPGIRRK